LKRKQRKQRKKKTDVLITWPNSMGTARLIFSLK